MSFNFENTELWKKTLAVQGDPDVDSASRERLRNAYLSFRNRVAYLASEIHQQLPDYTVHDITHLDALWEMADLITGDDYSLTPTEAFVLGGAILLHDLGMGLASYPRGIEQLKNEESWVDVVTAQINNRYNRPPTLEEIESPPEEIKSVVIEILLRSLHAKHAEELAFTHWKSDPGNPPQYLIEDNEIRLTFGRIIGLIAHSHWWAVNKLESTFSRTLGSPPWCPNDWKVDPLKIACILRVADASHIDSRRAPSFLRAIRKPSRYSDEHWKFQEKLQKPYLSEDALTYSSGYAFPLQDASSWWLCLDSLKMIDRELRNVDSLLADKRLQRFSARRVAAIESPERLVDYIPTESWFPVDAHVQVGDVPRLVKSLGGDQLYGRDLSVALRELIQNGADAIKVRRQVENRENTWGEINVRLGEDDSGEWLEIEDNGIGMSTEVLTRYLLDFGTSYWGSSLMLEEFPGLLASGIKFTGKYGIGFFSVFMLGFAVRVRTRRANASQSDTLILEFNTGISSRPILRPATSEEIIRDGGTSIKVWLTTSSEEVGGLLSHYRNQTYELEELCAKIAPSLDVNLIATSKKKTVNVISASDWINGKGETLLRRLFDNDIEDSKVSKKDLNNFLKKASSNLRILQSKNNEVVGRACITVQRYNRFNHSSPLIDLTGVVTVGGLVASKLSGISGILTGVPERAARDIAIPIVSNEVLKQWATEQALLVPNLYKNPQDQASCASVIWQCGGETMSLPIAIFQGKWQSYIEIANQMNMPDQVILLDPMYASRMIEKFSNFKLLTNVIIVENSGYSPIMGTGENIEWPDVYEKVMNDNDYYFSGNLGSAVLNALSECWDVSIGELILASNLKSQMKSYRSIIIGYVNELEIKEPAYILKKPTQS